MLCVALFNLTAQQEVCKVGIASGMVFEKRFYRKNIFT